MAFTHIKQLIQYLKVVTVDLQLSQLKMLQQSSINCLIAERVGTVIIRLMQPFESSNSYLITVPTLKTLK